MSSNMRQHQEQHAQQHTQHATSAIAPRAAASTSGARQANIAPRERNKASKLQRQAHVVSGFLNGQHPGWIPFHPAVAEACMADLPRDRKGRVRDADLANLAALFIAACYGWSGRSSRLEGGWFEKTDDQWRDELCVRTRNRLWDVIRFVCLDDATGAPLGVPGVGIVRRRTGGYRNSAQYRLDEPRIAAWWLARGLQPALSAPEVIHTVDGVVRKRVDNSKSGAGSCRHVSTPSCRHVSTTTQKLISDDEKKTILNTDFANRDFVIQTLKEIYGGRWLRALNRNAPEVSDSPERQMTIAVLRANLARGLDYELEQYHRDQWGIADEAMLFELGAGCAYLDLPLSYVREIGDRVRGENAGRTQRNPTGVYIHRLRSTLAKWAGLARLTQEGVTNAT